MRKDWFLVMGSCVSTHKNSNTAALRFTVGAGSSEEGKKLFTPALPADMEEVEKDQEGRGEIGGGEKTVDSRMSFRSTGFGSKDEAFFDSKAWLDSDCEDDFFSVNGDFTPSGGSTPANQVRTPMTPRLNKTLIETFPDTKSEASPRKKLAQLLIETLPDGEANKEQPINGNADENINVSGKSESPMSLDATPSYQSGPNSTCSSEKISNGDLDDGKVKPSKAMNCCLPVVVPNFHLYERKKHRLTPEVQNGG